MRYLVGSIKDWSTLIKEAYRCTKPGGYIECFEGGGEFKCQDTSTKEHTAMDQWGEFFAAGGEKIGRSFRVLQNKTLETGMKDAGFVDIYVENIQVGGDATYVSR